MQRKVFPRQVELLTHDGRLTLADQLHPLQLLPLIEQFQPQVEQFHPELTALGDQFGVVSFHLLKCGHALLKGFLITDPAREAELTERLLCVQRREVELDLSLEHVKCLVEQFCLCGPAGLELFQAVREATELLQQLEAGELVGLAVLEVLLQTLEDGQIATRRLVVLVEVVRPDEAELREEILAREAILAEQEPEVVLSGAHDRRQLAGVLVVGHVRYLSVRLDLLTLFNFNMAKKKTKYTKLKGKTPDVYRSKEVTMYFCGFFKPCGDSAND